MKKILVVISLQFFSYLSFSQSCDAPGKKPYSAFPVCGTTVFTQSTVPLCSGVSLPSPKCKSPNYLIRDVNAFYYKFTCFEAGSLGLVITPKNLGDDYDWELYDITGRDPNDIYTDGSLVVTSNWSGESGKTGASSAGTTLFSCGGPGQPLFTSMAQLKKDHNYLLMVSHFTESQSGYDLSFEGGTANITDTIKARLKNAVSNCGGNVVRVKLNKRMKCNSVAADGSDFFVAGGSTISAVGIDCSYGFDTDSLEIKLSQPLTPGNYQLGVKKGSDGNTLLDYCDNPISETERINFTVYPIAPTPMDSMVPVKCSPQNITLVFRKPIACSSIAKDASDFSITGPYAVTISSVKGKCNSNETTNEIVITLAQPLQQKGNFVLTLQRGSDGNTLLDECAQETPVGSSLSFSVKDTVNANFSYIIDYNCEVDVVNYFHAGGNEINKWQWNLDRATSTQQNPQASYSDFTPKEVNLIVSNGFCSDTSSQRIVFDNFLEANFLVVQDNCPMEPIQFTSIAEGKIVKHNWSFGDGSVSNEESPEHIYTQPPRETDFDVRYTVTDTYGCEKSINKPIKIYSSCTVYTPNAFTPNGDGLNDVFRVNNAVKAENFVLMIFNRWGQPLFETRNWKQGWDGRYQDKLQPTGTYVWMMQYIDTRTNKKVERKGTVSLIR